MRATSRSVLVSGMKMLIGPLAFSVTPDLSPPNTKMSSIGDTITGAYKERQFEIAVGEERLISAE